MVKLYAPTGETNTLVFDLASRPGGLDGLNVWLLDNGKASAAELLEQVGNALASGHDTRVGGTHRKRVSGAGAGASALRRMAEEAGAVVNALADCGGCTSWSVHDAVELERAGVPTISVVADQFLELFATTATALGMPDLPRAVTPYPVAPDASDPERLGRRVTALMPDLIKGLTSPPGHR